MREAGGLETGKMCQWQQRQSKVGPEAKERGSVYELKKKKKQIIHQSPQKKHSPADPLILAQNSALQNYKIIHLCCFKPQSLWPLVLATTEHHS